MSSVYFSHGTRSEQNLLEDLVIESIHLMGSEWYYIPRHLVGLDPILGEDRLSAFTSSYPIECYLENSTGFEGQGQYIAKFGLMTEYTATLSVARRTWERLVGRFGQTIIPNRPCEGDLLYFPLSKSLFEIKYVETKDIFYQLNKLYVYSLSIELFQYASEKLDTGVSDIDVFESLKTQDLNKQTNVRADGFGNNEDLRIAYKDLVFNPDNPFGEVVTVKPSVPASIQTTGVPNIRRLIDRYSSLTWYYGETVLPDEDSPIDTSAPEWKISRITFNHDGTLNKTESAGTLFDQIWNDRLTITYH